MTDENKFPSQLAERFQIRMPDGLRDRIKDAAEQNSRSMNSEIVARLEGSFDESVTEIALTIMVETYEKLIRENVALNRVLHRIGEGRDIHALLQEEDQKFQTRNSLAPEKSGGGGGRLQKNSRLHIPIKSSVGEP